MYKRLEDVKSGLDQLREVGLTRGKSVGFDWEVLPYSVKLGTTTYIAAPPATGKTEFHKEILINLSCLHGWVHALWTPETGTAEEVFAELCHSYVGKPFIKGQKAMSEQERLSAEYFINEHFIIIDTEDKDLNLEQFYKLINEIEIDIGKKIHTTSIDPWNELEEIYIPSDLGREDKYISRTLGQVRKNAKKENRHNFILTHVRDQSPITQGGITYFPFPHAREIAGGQTWFRKGMTVILMWRPPYPLSDENNRQYGKNELHVRIGKVKPKGTAERGTYILNLDTSRYQYYSIDAYEQRQYAERGAHLFESNTNTLQEKPLPFNTEFDNEETPF